MVLSFRGVAGCAAQEETNSLFLIFLKVKLVSKEKAYDVTQFARGPYPHQVISPPASERFSMRSMSGGGGGGGGSGTGGAGGFVFPPAPSSTTSLSSLTPRTASRASSHTPSIPYQQQPPQHILTTPQQQSYPPQRTPRRSETPLYGQQPHQEFWATTTTTETKQPPTVINGIVGGFTAGHGVSLPSHIPASSLLRHRGSEPAIIPSWQPAPPPEKPPEDDDEEDLDDHSTFGRLYAKDRDNDPDPFVAPPLVTTTTQTLSPRSGDVRTPPQTLGGSGNGRSPGIPGILPGTLSGTYYQGGITSPSDSPISPKNLAGMLSPPPTSTSNPTRLPAPLLIPVPSPKVIYPLPPDGKGL